MPQHSKKTLIAHRGASAYRPEHTLEAYKLALEQEADYVEPDLQITKDGVLICMHDLTLERTTNVAEVFPDRAVVAANAHHWYVPDFTLAEIKTLDAGSWFDGRFNSARVPTFQEMIDLVKDKAGLYPETKDPEVYGKRGFDMERLLLEILRRNELDETPSTSSKSDVVIQSFSPASLKRVRVYGGRVDQTLLVDFENRSQLTESSMKIIREFAEGIGPSKQILLANPQIVAWAHAAGLSVTAYTFRTSDLPARFATVQDEMKFFLYDVGVDALFTDNPDQFPQ